MHPRAELSRSTLPTRTAPDAGFTPRLTYALAPPSRATDPERRRAIARAQSARISALPIDAVLVYDVQDEAVRNDGPRPFAFQPKVDPLTYALDELELGDLPLIVYRVVAEQDERLLQQWLDRLRSRRGRAVLVGAPSRKSSASLTLTEAYSVCRAHAPEFELGGVVIPERHENSGTEDARVWAKMRQGCRFFVSQTVWSVRTTERLLRDLRRRMDAERAAAPTILLTLSPCGSAQTLEFLGWLGVEVPARTKHELLSAKDMLERSIELAVENYARLRETAVTLGFTLGCNVESVSTRAAEVDASVELIRRIDRLERAESYQRVWTCSRMSSS